MEYDEQFAGTCLGCVKHNECILIFVINQYPDIKVRGKSTDMKMVCAEILEPSKEADNAG